MKFVVKLGHREHRTGKSKVPVVISTADDAILGALSRYYYLSARQICWLHYRSGSLTCVQSRLKRLTDAGYCQRLFLPRRTRFGSSPSVYRLARKGLNYLAAQETAVQARYRPSEAQTGYLALNHTLAVNDFLISAELLCREYPEVVIESMLHERDLKRAPLIVEGEKPGRISVIPDGFLDLRLNGQRQACVALELDRGTVEQAKWRQKVHGLIATAKGSYQQRFNTTSLTVAVIATPGDKRMWELLRWTEAELKQSSEDQADMFRFTSLLPTMVSPRQLFFSPVWRRPFFHGGISLLTS